MYLIESPYEDKMIEDYEMKKRDMIKTAMDQVLDPAMNKTAVMLAWLEKTVHLGSLNPGEKKWTKLRSYSFACETGATIGWGVTSPNTSAGRVVAMIGAVIQIPYMVYTFILIGEGREKEDGMRWKI